MIEELLQMLYWVPGIIISLTIHEYSHAAVANLRGDDTAKRMGRLTLNPLAHLDPIGFIMLLIAHFGWAKPVPVNPYNLTNPKRDMIWVSAAGPISNMILAFLIAIFIRIAVVLNLELGVLYIMLFFTFYINLILAVFNLIPIQPLDGSKIVMGLLPHQYAAQFEEFTKKGPFILIGIIIFSRMTGISILGTIFTPWITIWGKLLLGNQIFSMFSQMFGL